MDRSERRSAPTVTSAPLSCTEESKLRFMEKANGRDKGERSADQKKSIEEVVAGIKAHSARVPGWAWTIEQPDGSRMEKVLNPILGKPHKLRQCNYGYWHAKPTLIWTNIPDRLWMPREWRKGKCRHCNECNLNILHRERMTRRNDQDHRPEAGTATMPGYSHDARWNRVAPSLGEELAKAALKLWEEKRPEREAK